MKNLKIKQGTKEFLSNNKIKLCAVSLAMCTLVSFASCKDNSNVEISPERQVALDNIKDAIHGNMENIKVAKNEEFHCYVIFESVYIKRPIYNNDINGESIVGYKSELYQENVYTISYNEAERLSITETLDELTLNIKKK